LRAVEKAEAEGRAEGRIEANRDNTNLEEKERKWRKKMTRRRKGWRKKRPTRRKWWRKKMQTRKSQAWRWPEDSSTRRSIKQSKNDTRKLNKRTKTIHTHKYIR